MVVQCLKQKLFPIIFPLGFNIIHYYLAHSFIAMGCVAHIVLRGMYTKQL